MSPDWLLPQWPAPQGVIAFCTTRLGGVSEAPYDTFNLAHHVGDLDANVAANRHSLAERLPGVHAISWLDQVHGVRVVQASSMKLVPQADAQLSRQPGVACAILTADCLPVLLSDMQGSVVAAAHAGWRGLAGGVLRETVAAMGVPPERLQVWLGPAIGPEAFEVGEDVLDAFQNTAADAASAAELAACFKPIADSAGKYLADLYALARHDLRSQGIDAIYGGHWCTVNDAERFYSYRRDGVTGRMASIIAIREPV